jgi:uncharacterized membrane protein
MSRKALIIADLALLGLLIGLLWAGLSRHVDDRVADALALACAVFAIGWSVLVAWTLSGSIRRLFVGRKR